ncbi:OmpL47-type beta-barrel domain-containing protein [Actinomycetes bacterium NPDC127524]
MERWFNGKWLTIAVLILMAAANALGFAPSNVHAAAAADNVLPDGTGKKVLFDNTHGQTSGAADWVIDGGFSDFANGLKAKGFAVSELSRNIPFNYGEQAVTFDKLKDYDVFVIGEANIPYKKSEQDAMIQYVQNGGSIFFIADHYNADRNKNRWDASEVMNGYRRGAFDNPSKGMTQEEANSPAMQGVQSSDWMGSNFGIRFRYNAVGDVNAADITAPAQTFGITEGVNSVAVHAGSTLAVLDPSKAKGLVYLPQNPPSWGSAVDKGVYSGGGKAEGPFAAISKLGGGKAAFIGDSSPVEDASPKYLREETGQKKTTYDGFKEANDSTFLVQTVEWLAKKESYTNFSQAGIELDQKTPLILDAAKAENEDPATTIEPQAEPWSQPQAGYKWYDPTTFKPGSYGSAQAPAANPAYSLIHQSTLPSSQDFQIRVSLNGLNPGQTVSGLKLGIYLSGGAQIAKVKNEDGSWPKTEGYSSDFSVTANDQGKAYKDLTVRINGTKGAASLRLKQGSNNAVTEAVTVADVPAEPLPEDKPAIPDAISVNDARKSADGTLVTVEGTITSEPGVFGGMGFYLQDAFGGTYVYQNEAGYHKGDKVQITAVKKTYNSEVELTDTVSLKKTGTASVDPRVQDAVNDENQGQLITLENLKIVKYDPANGSGTFQFTAASPEGKETIVRIDGRTGISYDRLTQLYPVGSHVSITGISSIFNGAYQLKPLSLDQIKSADTEAPVTSVTSSGKLGEGSYNKEDVQINFSANDGSGTGVAKTEFRVNGGEWTVSNGSAVISDEGKNIVEFRSYDLAGNVESVKSVQVWIDKHAPEITLNGQVSFYQTDSAIPVKITAADQLSGVKSVKYILDNTVISDLQAVSPLDLTAGKHKLQVTAEDEAGNTITETYTLESKIDIDHLDELIDIGVKQGKFENKGIAKSLQAQIASIQQAKKQKVIEQKLKALETEVRTLKNKFIDKKFADIILQDIDYIQEQ